jgi:SAM-dependent methyltransferase
MSNGRDQDKVAQRIARGAVAHYEDAAYYDLTYKRRRHDVRYYVELAHELGGPVLELGVGTGRVALALAKAGVSVTGVEPVPAMLEKAREKAATLPRAAQARLRLRGGDGRKVRLKQRFPLVTAPFNVLMHVYSRVDLERFFATVHAHLTPGGRFAFDVLMPDLHAMVRNPGRLYRGPKLTHPVTGKHYEYFEAFEYDAPREVQMVSMVFQNTEDLSDLRSLPLSQRQFFPQELEALLHYNGFALEHLWGDFERGPLSNESESQVVVVKKRKGF